MLMHCVLLYLCVCMFVFFNRIIVCLCRKSDVFSPKVPDEFSNFLDVLQRTELFGVPTLLYAILLHAGPPRHSTTPPILPSHTLAIAMAAVKLINNCFLIQLNVVQVRKST